MMMLKSNKVIGNYEKPILINIKNYFEKCGYISYIHSRLNLAWSKIVSDIDVVAFKNNETIIIEVKSSHDDFYKAFKQLINISGYADKLYIATDKKFNDISKVNWVNNDIGLIYVNKEGNIEIIKKAKYINNVSKNHFIKLKKKCLYELVKNLNISKKNTKQKMTDILFKHKKINYKKILKLIAFCNFKCTNKCIYDNIFNKEIT